MALDKLARQAMKSGRDQADAVIEARHKALKRRARVQRERGVSPAAATMGMKTRRVPELLSRSASSAGLVLAEGDSWFDYPLYDVLDLLEDEHGFDVESVARAGDRVESMAYAAGQLSNFSRRLEKLLRESRVPKAILLSGGGNDVAGLELGVLLNHAASGMPGLSENMLKGMVDERIRAAVTTIIAGISKVAQHWLQRPIPILLHGYDHPVPDGRGVLGGWGPLPGPWLKPSLDAKGHSDPAQAKALMETLIDRLNTVLMDITNVPQFQHVSFIDLRGTLSTGSDYKQFWGNELHPTEKGFKLVAARFVERLNQI